MSKPKLKGGIGETTPKILKTTDQSNLEKKIRFSLVSCNIDKYCIRLLTNQEIIKLYSTLGKFERMTWKEVHNIKREKGFSIESKDSNNYKMLKEKYELFSTFFHFRVNGTPNSFRVFAACQEDLGYILIFDKDGKINH